MRFSVAFEGPKQKLYSIVEDMIEPRLSRIDGVANVEVRGLDKKELLVELDQGLLQAHNVDISVLNGLLSRNNINLSLGEVIDGGRKFSIRAIGEFQSIKEISRMPIPGKNIVLSDLAKVSYDYPIKRSFQKLNGHNAISIQVYKASTANMVRVSVKVRSALDKIRSEVGEDWLNIHIYRDESKGITDKAEHAQGFRTSGRRTCRRGDPLIFALCKEHAHYMFVYPDICPVRLYVYVYGEGLFSIPP